MTTKMEDFMTPVFTDIVNARMRERTDKVFYDSFVPEPVRPVVWHDEFTRIGKIAYVTSLTTFDENKLLALTDDQLDEVVNRVRKLQAEHEEKINERT